MFANGWLDIFLCYHIRAAYCPVDGQLSIHQGIPFKPGGEFENGINPISK